MKTKWKIVPVKSGGPIGYKWRWMKATDGKVIEQSTRPFDYYYDCLVDAQEHGFHVCQTKTEPLIITRGKVGA